MLVELYDRRVLVGILPDGRGRFQMFQTVSDGAPVIVRAVTMLVFMIIGSVHHCDRRKMLFGKLRGEKVHALT